ncbi:6,7-dimethyl-8-ribityllumazine synthase [Arthrobacter sp. zg-Y916]|uniref:6,7-dimethyl-8-ribityllumazine synthase n=1 Tax=Arthrobacter caoxuetaonis TaxID=2886935 RepID=A0A9X1MGR7_9MICC|nr:MULTISPECIES: 6,7-dimethyl-8-ribityllumazine synthase [Arthrobacter]MCC3299000.1 6,7-dimethyl-8-ribityllumazine synthase [Arthrobacter caoxuetaonis]MCC9193295.1 6,7-dimethyl-8-ribityllumazine synthase [Arthrobacter sp. zg-Y916]USQ58659.1 6,7-dimethyl-8-ribityllumazine synthase [Arthrobacter caoxuetaonis]
MSGHGAPENDVSSIKAQGLDIKVAVVAASWHTEVMNGLIEGALRAASDAGLRPKVIRVPGTFELSVAAARLAPHFDAVVALGVVVRGGTPHFDYVCSSATQGLTEVSVRTGTPVGFGVLTCDTDEQALDRAGLEGSSEDKGYEAFAAAVNTVAALRWAGV